MSNSLQGGGEQSGSVDGMVADRSAAAYLDRPWLAAYGNLPHSVVDARPDSPLAAFRENCAKDSAAPAVQYFDATLSHDEVDRLSDAFAIWMERKRVTAGDRVMIVVNNTPHSIIALLATWKLQAVPVPCNPMYQGGELGKLMADCRPAVVIGEHALAERLFEGVDRAGIDAVVVAVDPYDFQSEDDTRVLPPRARASARAHDLMDAVRDVLSAPFSPPRGNPDPDTLGLILYTSGTTGAPKGAMLSHKSMAQCAYAGRLWTGLAAQSRLLAIAPTFHITGLVSCCCAAFLGGDCLILAYRFDALQLFETIVRHKPTFLVAAATAFVALMALPQTDAQSFASLTSVFSGGAAVPPALIRNFRERTGITIYPAFGMTETSAGAIVCPIGSEVPVDPESGTLSIGVPMADVDAMIIDEEGLPVPVGVQGELLVRGPGLMQGYLNKPDETAAALAGGWMHTGDIAKMDADGWFYITDRKKDVIIASGYKVWPREVEEALYEHPAILEAAVIGISDDYRGESVKAIVSLKAGAAADTQALIAHCRDRLASFKVPRVIDVVSALPKTETGKISRALLRTTHGTG